MNREQVGASELENEIPPELDQALLDYFNISELEDGDYWIWGTIIDLIYDWRVSGWSYFFANKKCSKWESMGYTKKEWLTNKQEIFVRSLYHWIVYFSDIIQFLDLDNNERIITEYIKKRFPWEDWRWILAMRIARILR